MKEIVLTGGTGNLGQKMVKLLIDKKYNPTVLTSKNNMNKINDVHTVVADITNKDSLKDLFNDTDLIIHCASNPRNSDEVDVKGTQNILQSINLLKPPHLIYISIVGVDKSDWPYYQNKHKVERLIKDSGIPYTIFRITQFHDFVLHRIVKTLDTNPTGIFKLPKNMRFQSIDTNEAAKCIVETINDIKSLKHTTLNIGGPEILSIKDMAKTYLKECKRNEIIEEFDSENPFYKIFTTGINICPENKNGSIHWETYLKINKVLNT
ncbi:SDR family oxidoreductase [Mariniflexile gromovii]|uniref:NmrA family NAD(P)-binding protein n=1 Tax=Mariniflexile gromovii TaxID=362523 RepID=A0ABS4BUL3_9FLAO|nr:NmrA family NAD(P)-binding protein [Mariniflexile gromovii]MBP0904251.1 NmrA family NAD(P)-binding protein [Mariniflexile gromovii]